MRESPKMTDSHGTESLDKSNDSCPDFKLVISDSPKGVAHDSNDLSH